MAEGAAMWDSEPTRDQWLSMADVGPMLGIPYDRIQKSEWLACGHILATRHFQTYLIVGGELVCKAVSNRTVAYHLGTLRWKMMELKKGDMFGDDGLEDAYFINGELPGYDWEKECFVGRKYARNLLKAE